MTNKKSNGKSTKPKKQGAVAHIAAGNLRRVLEALDGLKGPRSTAMSWKLLQIREPFEEAQKVFSQNLQEQCVDPDPDTPPPPGSIALDPDKADEAKALLEEELEVPIHATLKLKELNSLTVEEDWHLGLLIELGIVDVS